jgi:hypothetical protein
VKRVVAITKPVKTVARLNHLTDVDLAGLIRSAVQARSALDTAPRRSFVAAPVFAELLAAPSRTEAFLDFFCKEQALN